MTEPSKPDEFDEFTDAEAQDYPLPDFGVREHNSSTNALDKRYDWYEPPEEDIDGDAQEVLKPLTIEDIEAIRQAAYEEGFAEGRQNGHNEGLEAGRLDGLAQGHQEGFSQGLTQGLEQGQAQIDTLAGYWQSLIDELHQPIYQITEQVQLQLVELIIAVARSVLRCELTTNRDVIIQTLKEAVAAMPVVNQTLQISLHPDDLLVIEGIYPSETQQKKNWQLIADGSLERGDCVIETRDSTIDINMEQVIEQALKRFRLQNAQTARHVERDDSHFTPPHQPATDEFTEQEPPLELSDDAAEPTQHEEGDIGDITEQPLQGDVDDDGA